MTDDTDRPDHDACPTPEGGLPNPLSGLPEGKPEPENDREPGVKGDTTARPHPLHRFSLKGRADEYEARAQDTKPLMGQHVMSGQATMFYAPPQTQAKPS